MYEKCKRYMIEDPISNVCYEPRSCLQVYVVELKLG